MTAPRTDTDPAIEAQVQAYLKRPYRRCIQADPEEGGYYAFVPECSGVMADGATPTEALAELEEAFALWLYVGVEHGDQIPDPAPLPYNGPIGGPNGKLLVRVPRSVHAEILARAAGEGVSANQFILTAITRELGRREASLRAGQ
jgi:antitoxin HicB